MSLGWSCFTLWSTLALYSKMSFWCFKAPERKEGQGRQTSEGQEREKKREEREEGEEEGEKREREGQGYSQ